MAAAATLKPVALSPEDEARLTAPLLRRTCSSTALSPRANRCRCWPSAASPARRSGSAASLSRPMRRRRPKTRRATARRRRSRSPRCVLASSLTLFAAISRALGVSPRRLEQRENPRDLDARVSRLPTFPPRRNGTSPRFARSAGLRRRRCTDSGARIPSSGSSAARSPGRSATSPSAKSRTRARMCPRLPNPAAPAAPPTPASAPPAPPAPSNPPAESPSPSRCSSTPAS